MDGWTGGRVGVLKFIHSISRYKYFYSPIKIVFTSLVLGHSTSADRPLQFVFSYLFNY